jgi:ergothioneine biosynthesis protein EgtB
MTTSLSTMIRLRAIQNKTRKLFEGMSDLHYRLQFHPDLSPAGWHLGHGLFIENYWLYEVIQNNNEYTADTSLYIPGNCPEPERGPRLPPLNETLQKISEQQDINDLLLLEKTPPLSDHILFKDEYIENFIIQHYAQHYETIHMVLQQIALKADKGSYQPKEALTATMPKRDLALIPQNSYTVGGEKPLSYDNELPSLKIDLNAFYISAKPVSNSEYLNFMHNDGYTTADYWSIEGWKWLQNKQLHHPEHWRQNEQQQWYGVNYTGAYDLQADDAVYGINYYEACAFAKWANARLPHEHEWETAARLAQLSQTAHAWEWCNNTFHPYDNFMPFPYDEYSTPWFDGKHYVLKGGSTFTRPEIKRASFRNFYQPHQRHMFAGLRLAYE